jgi:hypothetical protein
MLKPSRRIPSNRIRISSQVHLIRLRTPQDGEVQADQDPGEGFLRESLPGGEYACERALRCQADGDVDDE